MIHFILLQNRMGKTRLAKFYVPCDDAEREKTKREVHALINGRDARMSNYAVCGSLKLVYRRYAGLFFCFGIEKDDNELFYMEFIHLMVEVLDMFFRDVCELDLVFNFHKVYLIIDEMILAGEVEEVSRAVIMDRLRTLDITNT
ncbi:clathrin coat assembly protein AP17, putative [Trypanosoma cruzi]|uniref:AP complex subunit sigma n=1 Tax=Trypanosoma cruzi (strain CL Brener) TaxID=353153 RepID=Q4E596_TRYCC|nr:clathrin coat assembly protein AP17, putative [Trypanosoma cruzi]EAN99940.1 clathrin coat assembly protein AP17, putative [Trypanosoma cruzi]|eukprot:XP_821791.1 clathrin coat assembly protein AP17 [Trypanosoma cruzi strain CL Brener]